MTWADTLLLSVYATIPSPKPIQADLLAARLIPRGMPVISCFTFPLVFPVPLSLRVEMGTLYVDIKKIQISSI